MRNRPGWQSAVIVLVMAVMPRGVQAEAVRSTDPVIASLITRGREESPTFQRLVQIVHVSNGIVYVERGECRGGVLGCLKGITASGSRRIVRLTIALGRRDADIIATIGHELQHAVEVLSDPAVVSTATIYLFYRRAGMDGRTGRFETAAAIAAGDAVRADLQRRSVGRVRRDPNP
jgi:hypothetical protein